MRLPDHLPRAAGLAALALLGAPAPGQDARPAGAEEVAAWFAAHGYPDPARRPFARIARGERVEHGFVLTGDDERITALTLDGQELELPRRGVALRELALSDFARERLRSWTAEPHRFGLRRSTTPRPGHATVFLLLAFGCERNAERGLAEQLVAAARQLYNDHKKSLLTLLGEDLARAALWQLMLDLRQPELGWEELQARCQRVAERFADVRLAGSARRLAEAIARMLRAEQARAAAPAAGELADLVFALRDQRGRPADALGSFDVFADPRGEESPAARLAAAGEAAIPHLLPALDADDLTRCVSYLQPELFSHRVLTRGEVARAVFTRITGYPPRNRADGERWWRDYTERGAVAVYADGAMAGDAEQARRLLALDREVALAVLSAALAERPPATHAALLEVLGGVPDAQVTEVLRSHLRQSPDGQARLAAAVGLCLRGEVEEAVRGAIAVWRANEPKLAVPALGLFLVGSGRRDALAAVFARRDRLGVPMFAALGGGAPWRARGLRPDGSGEQATWTPGDPEDRWVDDLERHLGELVEDGPFALRMQAVKAMVARWPEVYAFDESAPAAAQDAALAALRARWRERQGLPPAGGR